MEKYKFIDDLTSDVMFEAYGKSLRDVFANAAEAMFTVICHIKKVKPKKALLIEAEAESVGKLMIAWLQELIAAVDTEGMFFSKFQVVEISEKRIKAKCWGEPVSPEKGETVVKAVTYYKYLFEKTKEGFKTRVALDI
ncbi:MAG: archease [Candidatus Aenigmarchaeota archaeon]|nr:archease [Candidatus Aenigmarchaeota archaeon]